MADFEFPSNITIFDYKGAFPYIADIGGIGGIAHQPAKFAAMPSGFVECDGFRSRTTPQGGKETERQFVGPWSQWKAFQAWAMGYAYRSTSTLTPYPAGTVRRSIPAQDPEFPDLWCESCEVMRGEGAWVLDPNNGALFANGQVGVDAKGNLTNPLPCTAFVDNAYGGSIGFITEPPAGAPPGTLPTVTNPTGKYGDGKVRMRLTYRSRLYEVRPDSDVDAIPAAYIATFSAAALASLTPPGEFSRFVERVYGPSIEALPLSRIAAGATQQLQFTSGTFAGKVIPEAGVVMLKSMQVEWRIYSMPDPPIGGLVAMMGCINKFGFDGFYDNLPGYCGFDAGTLLFQQPTWRRRPREVTGNVTYDLSVRALFRGQGWNNALAQDGNWYPFAWVDSSSGKNLGNLYPSIDAKATIFAATPAVQWQS